MTRERSRSLRIPVLFRLDPFVYKEFKLLAKELGTPVRSLLTEAVDDLILKYYEKELNANANKNNNKNNKNNLVEKQKIKIKKVKTLAPHQTVGKEKCLRQS